MKTFILEIIFEDTSVAVREKTTEGITIPESRQIIAILEEYKTKMVDYIIFASNMQQKDMKKETRQ